MLKKNRRHILGLSGGKDSAALALYLKDKIPNIEYFFCDTQKELPETYDFLERLQARLGKRIQYLAAERGFDHWLDVNKGLLPSPTSRWCTKKLKLEPMEDFVGDDYVTSYIGIRADENRSGYISTKNNIQPRFPFIKDGISKKDVFQILENSGIGVPKYYEWRSRSGCFFCFFQRKYEWVMLSEKHPELFEKAVKYEENHSDGRKYYWNESESLRELIKRKEEIIRGHEEGLKRKSHNLANSTLVDVFSEVLDDENDEFCIICNT